MKTIAPLLALALAAVLPARALLFGPAAVNNTVLGGIAGAIIGKNSGDHNAGRGALIGAGAGYVLGSIVTPSDYYGARRIVAYPPLVVGYAPALTAAPATLPVMVINNCYNSPATPMSGANAMFGR